MKNLPFAIMMGHLLQGSYDVGNRDTNHKISLKSEPFLAVARKHLNVDNLFI